MLTRLIVHIYGWLIEIFLWVMLLLSAVVGYNTPVPLLKGVGAIIENEMAWSIYMAIFMPVVVFLVLAVLTGPFLVLVDIRKSVRALEAANSGNGSVPVQPIDFREPHL